MIPVKRPAEPDDFDARVRRPGKKWLKSGSKARPPSYWLEVRDELAEAFFNRCGYTAMWDLNGTVDHFSAQNRDRSNLYEWGNLRYASQWINSSKKAKTGFLDPYDVEDGWFEVLLPSLQLVATSEVPESKRTLVETTLSELPIAHDERVIRQRRAWLEAYERGEITVDGLRTFAPLLAAAIAKRDALEGPATPSKRKPQKKTKAAPKKRTSRR